MQRLPVESTDLVSIGYDHKDRVLEIEFKEGRIYQYQDVAPDIYERFTRADSYGEFFFAHINKHYRYERIDEGGKTQIPSTLAFVTGNARKVRDLQMVCVEYGIEVEQLDLPVDEIQAYDAEKIATHKAKQAYKLAGRPVVVNGAFWNILGLRGFPGAYMSYVTKWLKVEDFLALMQGKIDRTVCCTDTLVYHDGKRTKVFSQDQWGEIGHEPRGEGLSIEQLVTFTGQTQTIAEAEGADLTAWRDFAKWYNLQRRIARSQ